jgi:SAM-dependent methyltransferase
MTELDQTKVEAFTGTMIAILNGGMLALMTSIGYQTGLFEARAGLPPSTSEQIAEAAGLNERYVREWLNTMAAGKIVEYTPDRRTYTLPPEHAATLTQAAGPNNMATFARMIPILAAMEEPGAYDLVTAFDVIHDQAQPRVVLKNVATVLKPDGTFLMVDIKASSQVHENLDHPMGPFLYTTSAMHCMTVSLALDGEGLGTM